MHAALKDWFMDERRYRSFGESLIRTALILCASMGAPAAFASSTAAVPVGGVLREATLQGLNGPSRHLNAYRGTPLLINIWASWCGPCREEMASIERLAWLSDEQYFAIIGISTDDSVDQAAALLKGTNATISQFIDQRRQMEDMLGASALPLTVLVDADGRVLNKIYGAQRWDGPDALRFINQTFHRGPRNGRSGQQVRGSARSGEIAAVHHARVWR